MFHRIHIIQHTYRISQTNVDLFTVGNIHLLCLNGVSISSTRYIQQDFLFLWTIEKKCNLLNTTHSFEQN